MAASGGRPPPDDDTAFSVRDEGEGGPDVEVLEEGSAEWEPERRLFGVRRKHAARELYQVLS